MNRVELFSRHGFFMAIKFPEANVGLVIAGPLAAGLAGAGAGAATGGLVGALTGTGVPEDEAKIYENEIKDGGIYMGYSQETKKTRVTLTTDGITTRLNRDCNIRRRKKRSTLPGSVLLFYFKN